MADNSSDSKVSPVDHDGYAEALEILKAGLAVEQVESDGPNTHLPTVLAHLRPETAPVCVHSAHGSESLRGAETQKSSVGLALVLTIQSCGTFRVVLSPASCVALLKRSLEYCKLIQYTPADIDTWDATPEEMKEVNGAAAAAALRVSGLARELNKNK